MSTDTWTFNGSAGWAVKGNWSGGVIPVSGDTVVIDQTLGGPYTISYNNAAATTLQAVVLGNANATLTFDTVSNRTLAISTGGTGTLAVSAGTVIVGNTGTTTTDIINTNTVLLSGGSIAVNGRGELNIGTTTGSLGNIAEAGGSLGVSGGNLTASTFNVSGGSFSLSNGTITASGAASLSGTDTISGGTFTANGITIGSALTLNGGTLASSGGAIALGSAITLTMSGGAALIGGTSGLTFGNSHAEIVGSGTLSTGLTGPGGGKGNTATILASGGVLDVTNAVTATAGLNLQIDSVAGSVLRFDSTEASGNGVTFNAGTVGALELNGTAAVGGLSDAITGLGTAATATSVSGDNFINIQGVNIGQIRVAGSTTNQFNGSTKVIDIYSDAAATTLVGAITLAAAPSATTFIDWGLDSSVNGNALGGGTDLFLSSVICYAAGTLILTDRGEVPVEALAEGDQVITLQDGQQVPMPVKWMGVRHIDLGRHPAPHAAAPIRIRAGAFGDDLPRRDLLVSPAHAIYIDGKLVPANLLVNHMTIVQDLHAAAVTYHHVELERHAVIFAEGLTSESYLDMDNRAFFSNAGQAMLLHPECHVNAGHAQWEDNACAPLVVDAEAVAPIWHDLAARAQDLGHVPPRFITTRDADLHLEADGRRLRPIAVAQGRHTFMLPAGTADIVLHSRTAAPADLDPLSGDWRPLGVAVRGMTLRKGDEHIAIPADHPALTQGWHAAEQGNGHLWRWTAGKAAIPMIATAQPVMLDIDIGMSGTYVLARSDQEPDRLAA